jgi:hypothetical protein
MTVCGLLFVTGLHMQNCWAAAEPNKPAGDAAKKVAPAKSEWDQAMDAFHHPTDWLDMGADMRVRDEYGANIYTVNRSAGASTNYNYTNWQRYRPRVWAKIKADADVDFNARLIDEFRTWEHVPKATQSKAMNWDETLLDNFNVTARNLGTLPVTAVVGRQEIMLGEGWLVMDGTPLDGSRTMFLDAARLTVDWKEQNTKADLIYVDQAAATDRWLHPLNDQNRFLIEEDQQAAIVYLTHKLTKTIQTEGYYIYSDDSKSKQTSTNMPAAWAQNAQISTFGAALAGQVDAHWSYRLEGAVQTGNRNDRDLQALATNNRLNYAFNDDYKNSLKLAYEYVSGDDQSTSKDERFDMLWGEWPRWSEMYIYTYSKEGAVAENSNLHRVNLGHIFWPDKKLQVQTDYMALWADHSRSDLGPAKGFSDTGLFRGHLLTCWLRYQFTPQIKGHLMGEYLWPGNYYTVRDNATWLRAQIEMVF